MDAMIMDAANYNINQLRTRQIEAVRARTEEKYRQGGLADSNLLEYIYVYIHSFFQIEHSHAVLDWCGGV